MKFKKGPNVANWVVGRELFEPNLYQFVPKMENYEDSYFSLNPRDSSIIY